MKKFLSTIFTLFMLLNGANDVRANVGDIVSEIYSTDILTYVDNVPIQGYSINGKTMICLEDLENYGFSVMYNDSIRTLIVTKTGERDKEYNPYIERGKVGDIIGYVVETDIKAIVNGKYANAYAINGKMVAAVEDLGTYNEVAWSPENDRPIYNCKMSFKYDDSVRKLWLFTEPISFSESEKGYSYWKNAVDSNVFGLNVTLTDDYAIHYYGVYNRIQSAGTFYATISYKNGASEVSLVSILQKYGIKTDNLKLFYDDEMNLVYPSFKTTDINDMIILSLNKDESYIINPYTMYISSKSKN